jgi:hypothetical protein
MAATIDRGCGVCDNLPMAKHEEIEKSDLPEDVQQEFSRMPEGVRHYECFILSDRWIYAYDRQTGKCTRRRMYGDEDKV